MTLIDTNVLLDLVTDDASWFDWSAARVREAASRGPVLINDIVYAEASIRYSSIERYDAMLSEAGFVIEPVPKAALFLAGKIFTAYRRSAVERKSILPDFFIGAHAAVAGLPLLTRDVRRFRNYFPTVKLIAPDVA